MLYRMWTPGDEKPKETPKNCQVIDDDWGWLTETGKPCDWGHLPRRWPAEQRPTAFGLLSTEEQEELEEARDAGKKFQYLSDNGGWCNTKTPLVNKGWIYRIKPETLNFKVTMNGKPVNPKDISKETWMSFRGE